MITGIFIGLAIAAVIGLVCLRLLNAHPSLTGPIYMARLPRPEDGYQPRPAPPPNPLPRDP